MRFITKYASRGLLRYLGYQVADSVGVSLVSGVVSSLVVVLLVVSLLVVSSLVVVLLVVVSLVVVLLVVVSLEAWLGVWLGAWLLISSGSLSPLELDWSEESSLLEEGRLEALLLVATLELNAPKLSDETSLSLPPTHWVNSKITIISKIIKAATPEISPIWVLVRVNPPRVVA